MTIPQAASTGSFRSPDGGRARGGATPRGEIARAVATPTTAAAALAGAGFVLAGMTPMPGTVQIAGLGLGGIVLASGVRAARDQARQELVMTTLAGLAPLVGRGDHVSMRAQRWGSQWVGTPARVTLTYDPAVDATKETWLPELRRKLAQLLGDYEVVKMDSRRCRLTLRACASPEEPIASAPDPRLAARATETVQHLMGKDATVHATWQEGALVALEVAHKRGIIFSPSALARAKVERTVTTMLPGRWRARWDLEHDTVRLELRPKIPDSLERDLTIPEGAALTRLPYAVDEDGHVLSWDLSSKSATPHFLVVGSTGTGKTVVIRGVVKESCRRLMRVMIGDPKRVEFSSMRDWPNVEVVATTPQDIVAMIHQAYLLMEDRYAKIEAGHATDDDFDHVLVVLDEYRYFYSVVNAWYAQVKLSGGSKICPIIEEFNRIAVLGRTARIHLLVGTQRPDAAFFGGDMRDQFMGRCSLGRLSPEGAKMMWNAHHIGVAVPRGVPGRGTAVGVDGEPCEAQSYWAPDPLKAEGRDLELIEAMRPAECRYPRRVFVPPPTEDENGEPINPQGRYYDYLNAEYVLASERPALVAGLVYSGPAPVLMADEEPVEDRPKKDSYAEAQTVHARALEGKEGFLLLVDESQDLWAVIEAAEPDLNDDQQINVCWRSDQDGDDFGVIAIDAGEFVEIREPLDDVG